MLPCQAQPDLWFSDDPSEQALAKDGCQDCPMRRFTTCQAEGWSHEHGVFGGLSAEDRKAQGATRFKKAVAVTKRESVGHDRYAIVRKVVRLNSEGMEADAIALVTGVSRRTVFNMLEQAAA